VPSLQHLTLDLDTEFQPGSGHKPFATPKDCPRCANSFDSVVPGAVDAMQKIYKALAGLGHTVTFAVPAPHSESEGVK
jgi:hypothetical protein